MFTLHVEVVVVIVVVAQSDELGTGVVERTQVDASSPV